MNIKDAKEQIKNAITAYLTKDEMGRYCIPPEKQRPVFLMGPPGIGKTAIMKQIAEETGIGLLSYSMTHHTRQSLLGLPFIEHKTYGGKEYSVSEYTMSEIIASVYDLMEVSGVREGLLFIDEINCVSETLAPIMLQFLQYKMFGKHRIPDGWIVVAAGNPPEYNDSVREFDIVTWDRLKRVDIEPDFDAWKEFAYKTGVHSAVVTYLGIKRNHFFEISTTVDGKRFVTPRGWDDLGRMIELYEKNKIGVDLKLVAQYVQDKKIAIDFANYYDLFQKYRQKYRIGDILDGKASADLSEMVRNEKFDEKYTLIGLLLEATASVIKDVIDGEKVLNAQAEILLRFLRAEGNTAGEMLVRVIDEAERQAQSRKAAGALSADRERTALRATSALRLQAEKIETVTDRRAAAQLLKKDHDAEAVKLKKDAAAASKMLSNAINFCDGAFSEQELSIFITELTASASCAEFLGKYGCPEYFAHNKNLLIYERGNDIAARLKRLDSEG